MRLLPIPFVGGTARRQAYRFKRLSDADRFIKIDTGDFDGKGGPLGKILGRKSLSVSWRPRHRRWAAPRIRRVHSYLIALCRSCMCLSRRASTSKIMSESLGTSPADDGRICEFPIELFPQVGLFPTRMFHDAIRQRTTAERHKAGGVNRSPPLCAENARVATADRSHHYPP